MQVKIDDLTHPAVHELLREHLAGMHASSPICGVHALDIPALKRPGITFWTAWEGPELLGCGALSELSPAQGEIKSMRTAAQHLRKGVGQTILTTILDEAKRRRYDKVSLETGSSAPFLAAHALYEKAGFVRCGPFGDYSMNSFSVFMEKKLE
jgi:putative acetyltransferase